MRKLEKKNENFIDRHLLPRIWNYFKDIKEILLKDKKYKLKEDSICSEENNDFYKLRFETCDNEMAEAFEFAGNRSSIYYAIFWVVHYFRKTCIKY